MAANVIDSFLIALGFRLDEAGAKQAKKVIDDTKENLLSLGTAVKAAIAGFAVKEIAAIGSTFEQNQIQIAGFLSALGQSSDFNQGLVDAQGVIQQITADAAKLPGEAEDYIEVFKAGLPFVQAAMPGGSLKDITDFTNQLTAIGKTFGLDAGLISREFDHMLSPGRGMASLRLPLFRQLLSFMHRIPGQAKLTAESFNAMSESKRLELLQKTFGILQPMLDASADSFDAMWGAAVSGAKTFIRLATPGLFKQMKAGLQQVTALFINEKGTLTALGQSIADGAKMVLGWIGQVLSAGGGILKWLITSAAGALALKTALGLLGTVLTGLALSKTVDLFSKLTRLLLNPKLLAIGGLAIILALIIEDIYQFLTGGESVIGLLRERFPEAFARIGRGFGIMLDFVKQVVAGFGVMAGMVDQVIAGFGVMGDFISQTAAGFGKMADEIERAVEALKEFLGLNAPHSDALDAFSSNQNFDRRIGANDNAGEPTFLQRPATTTGASSVNRSIANSRVVNNTTHVDRPVVNIQTSDPDRAGEAAARHLTRNGQKGYF